MYIKNKLRYFYRVSADGNPVPGSLIARTQKPKGAEGFFVEIPASICCTTTTTSSTTTTTTTSGG